jgi:hypothetical protein
VHISYKATAQDNTRSEYALLEGSVAPGAGPPWHVHHREDEGFYVLEGTFEIFFGDERFSFATAASSSAAVGSVPRVVATVGAFARDSSISAAPPAWQSQKQGESSGVGGRCRPSLNVGIDRAQFGR